MSTAHPLRPHRADLALNLGILGIALPFLPIGPFAWAIARSDLRAARPARIDLSDASNPSEIGALQTARILGLAGSALTLVTFAALGFIALAGWGTWVALRAVL